MDVVLSTCWPWDRNKVPVARALEHVIALGVSEVAIRAPVYYAPLQPTHMAPVAQAYHAALIAGLPNSVGVSLWPVVSLYNPELMADRIAEYAEHYQPEYIYLDAERSWVINYIANLPKFLDRLAFHKASGRIRCPVGLGSYRRADLHPEMKWQVWLTHVKSGVYTIDFQAHQLYPIGWTDAGSWRVQMRQDVSSHDAEANKAGRPGMPWRPWLPAFTESGWTPGVTGLAAGLDELKSILGPRLQALHWWSMDQNLVEPQHRLQYAWIAGLTDPPPVPEPSPDDKLALLWAWYKETHP